MKTILKITAVLLVLAGSLSSCKKENKPKYDIYENHDISACGVNDPLQNIGWLKEYCDGIKEIQNFSSVYIEIYKVVDTGSHILFVRHSTEDLYAVSTKLNCINCNSDTIFHFEWLQGKGDFYPMNPDPAPYNEFMQDKEIVAELFHFAKQ